MGMTQGIGVGAAPKKSKDNPKIVAQVSLKPLRLFCLLQKRLLFTIQFMISVKLEKEVGENKWLLMQIGKQIHLILPVLQVGRGVWLAKSNVTPPCRIVHTEYSESGSEWLRCTVLSRGIILVYYGVEGKIVVGVAYNNPGQQQIVPCFYACVAGWAGRTELKLNKFFH